MLAFQYLVYWVFHLVYRVSSDLPSSFSIELLSCLTPFFKSVFALLDERAATSRPACLSLDLCLSMGLAGCHLLAQCSLNYRDPTVCLTVCRTVPFMAPFHLFSCFSCFFFFFFCVEWPSTVLSLQVLLLRLFKRVQCFAHVRHCHYRRDALPSETTESCCPDPGLDLGPEPRPLPRAWGCLSFAFDPTEICAFKIV